MNFPRISVLKHYKKWIEKSAAHPMLIELLIGSIGWGTGLESSRLMQSKGSSLRKVLQQEYEVSFLMYKSAQLGLVLIVTYLEIYTLLTVTLLNNSVEISSNLDPEPLKRVD